MNSISIREISKSYGKKQPLTALHSISLDVDSGMLYGLIGPDGAGKTTLFRILTTLILPDTGAAQVAGFDVAKDYRQIRKIIGYMPGRFSLYQDLSVRENLQFFATIFNTSINENYELIKDIYVQLEPFRNRRAGNLSGGMKQKLALCCALIHRPQVLFLDEPTTGVDVVSRKEFWEMLKRLRRQGITIFVSTPYMDEANLCDRIALIQEGKILSENTPQELLNEYPYPLYAVRTAHMYQALQDLRAGTMVEQSYSFGEFHHCHFGGRPVASSNLVSYLASKGHQDITVERVDPTIEDCFMELMRERREKE